jgi:AcrR family transcriptional regulator
MNADEVRPGLRDRKRAQTRARIETAAIELVLRDGLDSATVDAISDRADVSPRTFFNYFESKDAAILGLRPHEVDEEALSEQLALAGDVDPVAAVVSLVTSTMGVAAQGNTQMHRSRVEIMRRHPEILSGQFAQLSARRTRLAEHVAQILTRHPQFQNDADASARADILLAACVSAARSAIEDWTRTTDIDHLRETDADEAAVIERRAVALVYSTLGRLA